MTDCQDRPMHNRTPEPDRPKMTRSGWTMLAIMLAVGVLGVFEQPIMIAIGIR